jgi:D-glycero-D-manno-heptose 1,7-bisphosphate phosphatase
MSAPHAARLIVLDRDGVINEDSDAFIKSAAEWRPIAGSLEAIARLHAAGYRVVIFTNQSGLARGLFDRAALEAIHARLIGAVEAAGGKLSGIYVCPHGPNDACDCRKPLPGLLHRIESELGVSLQGVPVVGDARRDLEAALAVGARPLLVRTGKGERTLAGALPAGTEVFDDLAAVAAALLGERGDGPR